MNIKSGEPVVIAQRPEPSVAGKYTVGRISIPRNRNDR